MALSTWLLLATVALAQDAPTEPEDVDETPTESAEPEVTAPEEPESEPAAPEVTKPEPVSVPAPAPEAPEPASSASADRPARDGVAPFIGVQFGPGIPLSTLGVAPAPRLELGIELPVWERRLRLFAAGSFMRPIAMGEGKNAYVSGNGNWSYTLRQQEWTVAVGPMLRLPGAGAFVPEFALAPDLYLLQSTVDGEAGGAPFDESTEQYTRLGVYAAAGGAVRLGPGELTLNLSLSTSGLNGVVTGTASTMALTPWVGYRLISAG